MKSPHTLHGALRARGRQGAHGADHEVSKDLVRRAGARAHVVAEVRDGGALRLAAEGRLER